jgi:hypothetical protein
VRYEYNAGGRVVREKEYEGDAHGFYLHAQDVLGCIIEDLPTDELRLPAPAEVYAARVDAVLKGRRFHDVILGAFCTWDIDYAVSRTRRGWMVRVVGDQPDGDPFGDLPLEEYGPFKSKQDVRMALEDRGLDWEVKF